MVAAEADVVLLQFNGPEGGVQLAVLVLPVCVHASDEAQQQQHHENDDGQDNDVELCPGDLGHPSCGVVCGAAEAGQQGLGRSCSAQVARVCDTREAPSCGGGGAGGGRGRRRCW